MSKHPLHLTLGVQDRSFDLGNVRITAFQGPFHRVMACVGNWIGRESNPLNPASIIAIGNNGRTIADEFHRDRDKEKLQGDVLIITRANGRDLAHARASIDRMLWPVILQPGFDYPHFVSALDEKIDLLATGNERDFNPYTSYFLRTTIKMLFNTERMLKGTEIPTKTLLLLGRDGPRNLIVCRHGQHDTVVVPLQNTKDDQRFSLIQGHTILNVSHLDHRVYSLDLQQISDVVEGEAQCEWTQTMLSDELEIEDISLGIDGTPTVIITTRNEALRLIPAVVLDDRKLLPLLNHRIRQSELYQEIQPVVRVSQRAGCVASIARSGSSPLLEYARPELFGDRFVKMLHSATTGVWAR